MNLLKVLVGLNQIQITSFSIADNQMIIAAKSTVIFAKCPCCGTKSSSMHGFYHRLLRDLPLGSTSVKIDLFIRKFYCKNSSCQKIIFSEQPGNEVTSYSRMTSRTRQRLQEILIETSARKGALISKTILSPISASTGLRLIYAMPANNQSNIKNLGIDDWAYRKGISYGTILVNMDTRKAVDILKGRDGVLLKDWLINHPEIENISRDRASTFSAAVNEVLPYANQIADRFHLIKNLSDAVYEIIQSGYSEIVEQVKSKMISDAQNEEIVVPANHPIIEEVKGKPSVHRLTKFNNIKKLLNEAIGYRTISRTLHVSRNTVKHYSEFEELPNRSIPLRNEYHSYSDIIDKEFIKGNNLQAVFTIIQELGFKGSKTAFFEHYKNHPLYLDRVNKYNRQETISARRLVVHVCSPRLIARYIGLEDLSTIKNKNTRDQILQIIDSNPYIQKIRTQIIDFRKLFIDKNPEKLDSWMENTLNIKKRKLNTFIYGLKKDIDAVRNAIISPLSNGMVEGHVNRLKNIKRQMYGRAGFELLRRKVILALSG